MLICVRRFQVNAPVISDAVRRCLRIRARLNASHGIVCKYRVDSPACAHLCSPIPGIRRSGEPGRVQSLDPLTSGDLCALHGVATRLGAVQFPVTHAAADPRDGPATNSGCKPSGRTDVRAEFTKKHFFRKINWHMANMASRQAQKWANFFARGTRIYPPEN